MLDTSSGTEYVLPNLKDHDHFQCSCIKPPHKRFCTDGSYTVPAAGLWDFYKVHPKLYALAFLACHDAGWQHQPLKQVTSCTSCTSSDSPYFPCWQVPAAVHWALQNGHGRGS